jgi:hypothetical protein
MEVRLTHRLTQSKKIGLEWQPILVAGHFQQSLFRGISLYLALSFRLLVTGSKNSALGSS